MACLSQCSPSSTMEPPLLLHSPPLVSSEGTFDFGTGIRVLPCSITALFASSRRGHKNGRASCRESVWATVEDISNDANEAASVVVDIFHALDHAIDVNWNNLRNAGEGD